MERWAASACHGGKALMMARPTIVCLCGSTRFMNAFREANLRETLSMRIVLSIGCDTKSDEMLGLPEEVKEQLDQLHLQKINLADQILVLNVGGYVGPSTSAEICYARARGKLVRWLEPVDFYVFEVFEPGLCERCGGFARWLRFDPGVAGRVSVLCDRHAWVYGGKERE
jgi:hypothetical protein